MRWESPRSSLLRAHRGRIRTLRGSSARSGRECLDHLIIFNERHLRRVLSSYVDYYHRTRTHLSLAKDCPHSRLVQLPVSGRVIGLPQVGGLHFAMNASPPEESNCCLLLVAVAGVAAHTPKTIYVSKIPITKQQLMLMFPTPLVSGGLEL